MKLLGFYTNDKKRSVPANRRKKRNWRPLLVLLVLILLAVLVWSVVSAVREILARPTDPVELEYVGGVPVHEQYIPEDSPARPGEKRRVEWIVIHETDNFSPTADAEAHANFLSGLGEDDDPRSWHYTVDDHQIYHHLPDDEAAYHASDKLNPHGGNLNGIGIEICVNEGGDYEQAVENAVQLTAKLMLEYRLRVSDIQTHQYFSPTDKVCPAKLLEEERWDEFVERAETARKALREAEREAEREAKRREKEREDSILPGFLYDLVHHDEEAAA